MEALLKENFTSQTETPRLIYAVEDDTDVQNILTYHLKNHGYGVRSFSKAEEALEALDHATNLPLALIVDINLAGQMNGTEAVNFLRGMKKISALPVLMLTAKNENKDIVKGLNSGADDYLPKPFDIDVLVARVNSLVRRREHPAGGVFQPKQKLSFSEIELDPISHRVLVQELPVELTMTEFGLLMAMMNKPNEVFNRDDLLLRVMGPNKTVTERTIDVHIKALRSKLGKKGKNIFTVRGLGYKFVP